MRVVISALLSARFGDHLPRAAGDAYLAAVVELAVADPRRLTRLRIDMRNVRDVDCQFLVDDAAGLAEALPRVAVRHMDALHDEPLLRREDAQHLALASLV